MREQSIAAIEEKLNANYYYYLSKHLHINDKCNPIVQQHRQVERQ